MKSLSEITVLVLRHQVLFAQSQSRESTHLSFVLLLIAPTILLETDEQMSSMWTGSLRAGRYHLLLIGDPLLRYNLNVAYGSALQDGLLLLHLEQMPTKIPVSELVLPIIPVKANGLNMTVVVERGMTKTITLGSGNKTKIGALQTGGSLNEKQYHQQPGKRVKSANNGSRERERILL